MRYLSVCSGIESASAAWHELGWSPVAFADIDKFPSALLAERYPDVPNLGDMTRFDEWPALDIDALVGGTPCQSFSVAGQRGSLGDERGNLTLVFCRIADRFDPEVIVWENVPGVLSTPDNAFGCFLAGLTGCDTPVDPGRVGWTDAGVVAGPKRTAAWRVINAEGFVPQRRSRVFVVATRTGGRLHPSDVLFETEAEAFQLLGERAYTGPLFPQPEGVRRDSEEGGEAGKDVAGAVTASLSKRGWPEPEHQIAHALRADGFDASEDGTGRGSPLIVATAEGGGSVNLTRSNIGKQIHNQSPLLVFDTDSHSIAVAVDITNGLTGDDKAGTLEAAQYKSNKGQGVMAGMVVRRLTPLECERLMGLRDGYTLITYRGKPAKDGPRYKALGNSIVRDVMLWIGRRIEQRLSA